MIHCLQSDDIAVCLLLYTEVVLPGLCSNQTLSDKCMKYLMSEEGFDSSCLHRHNIFL